MTTACVKKFLVLEPFKYKKGSISRGQICEKIANNLNGLKILRFKVSKHGVRERYTLLSEKFKAKMKDEEKASGIEVAAEDSVENDKKKVGNAKAVEMRNRALESLGKTQKRQRNEEEENAKPKQKSRRSGGDTIAYLREKKMVLFRGGKRKNCSCKSSELKLKVNGKISQENNVRI